MPKAGFKSITVAETVYDHFQNKYDKIKPSLVKLGINSYSAWITYLLYKTENEM